MPRALLIPPTSWVCALLLAILGVGVLGRGYWTPDEPREADIAWRMSWQSAHAVPLLAGEPFCEKPPLTYWAAAIPIRVFGTAAWAARLPNLLYALITALSIGALAQRSCGGRAGLTAAAAISTFLLSYQVAIWLATDAALMAFVSAALYGLYRGFYGEHRRARLLGYTMMHAALGAGFLAKSAAAWMVPLLALLVLIVWERRWRELLRFELYAGLVLQAAMIGTWVGFVYTAPQGLEHLKVFFWNNLAGRLVQVQAPADLQYTLGHRNSPGKYLVELPMYLFPWSVLVLAAIARAWPLRRLPPVDQRGIRFALAVFVPALLLLSFAATARNIYLAPALPGAALLLGWWVNQITLRAGAWDRRALRSTAVLLLLAAAVFLSAVALVGVDSWHSMNARALYFGVSAAGIGIAAFFAISAWRMASRHAAAAASALLVAYAALLIGPASQLYREVDDWQNLASVGRAVQRDLHGAPLILLQPDETTRAFTDLYTSTAVTMMPTAQAAAAAAVAQRGLVLMQLPGRGAPRSPWLARHLMASPGAARAPAPLRILESYSLPNGRRYALMAPEG